MDSNKKVKVSIGLPTYNRAKLLRRAIDSIVSQSFNDFELIVVDDGSTDNTKGVVASYNDSRIRCVLHEKNRGLMTSRNTALQESRGEYIAFQDSDDSWHPDFLKENVAILEKATENVGGVYSRIEKKYFNGKKFLFPGIQDILVSGNLLEAFLGGGYLVTLQAFVMKRTCLDVMGVFDEDFRVFGDAEFIIRFAEHFEFAFNPNMRAYLEVQKDSISRNKQNRLEARKRIFEKHRNLFEQYPREKARFTYALARAFASRGEHENAAHYFRIALWSAPVSLGYWLRYFSFLSSCFWNRLGRS